MIIYLSGASTGAGSYTESAKSFHINCNGTEDNVFNCSYNTIQKHNCDYYEDDSVQCPGI